MKASTRIRDLISALSRSQETQGRDLVREDPTAVGKGVRARVWVKWGWDGTPVFIWLHPRQSAKDATEALSWALAHIALGHLKCNEPETLIVASLRKGSFPDLRLSATDLLAGAATDVSLRAFLWASYFVVDPAAYEAAIKGGCPPHDARAAVSAELGIPSRLVALWEKCQVLPERDVMRVIGSPQAWAHDVISRRSSKDSGPKAKRRAKRVAAQSRIRRFAPLARREAAPAGRERTQSGHQSR